MQSLRIPGSPLLAVGLVATSFPLPARELPRFTEVVRQTNGDVALRIAATTGQYYRLETAAELPSWHALATLRSTGTGTNPFTDGGGVSDVTRFYRTVEVPGTNLFTGDHVPTTNGDVIIHPINHASFVLRWNDLYIYNDPVGGSAPYVGLPRANLILVSHDHGDHFDAATLAAVRQADTLLIAPAAVYSGLSAALKARTLPLANGGSTNVLGLTVAAIPAYNANHPKGVGNGYVVTLGGRRFYMSGDTGNTPEMRALTDIDVAFLCMNVPFTMSLSEAVSATRAFRPRVVYPYHFRNQDSTLTNLKTYKQQVGPDLGVEVRPRTWY